MEITWRDLRGRLTQSPSPSPTRPQKHVTFQDLETSSGEGLQWGGMWVVSWQKRGWGVQFGAPTDLGAWIRAFTGGAGFHTRGRRGCNLFARALCGELWSLVGAERPPAWHTGLVGGVDDHCRLTQKVWASVEIPWVRYKALKVCNNYSLPPTPKCIGRKAFLPIPDPRIPCQEYREGQPPEDPGVCPGPTVLGQKGQPTKAWQTAPFAEMHSWVEVGHEAFYHLHWWSCLWRNHTEAGNPGGRGCQTEHNKDHMNPYAGTETCYITREAHCSVSWGARHPSYCFHRAYHWADQGASCPPTKPETDKKVRESLACELPSWTEIHPSHLVTPMGQVPSSLGNLR